MIFESCSQCQDEAGLRHCQLCQKYFCMNCRCEHLKELDNDQETICESYERGSGIEESSESCERSSGQSWLSNASIIAGLPDAKLKQTITRYKTLIILLEAELQARMFNLPRIQVSGPSLGKELQKLEANKSRLARPRHEVQKVIQRSIRKGHLTLEVLKEFAKQYGVKIE